MLSGWVASEWVDEVAIATELIETTLTESTATELIETTLTESTATELIETTLTESTELTATELIELTATESTELTATELIETTAAAEETTRTAPGTAAGTPSETGEATDARMGSKRTAQTTRSASDDPSTCLRDGGNSLHSNSTTMTEQGSAEKRSAAGSRSLAAQGSLTPLLSSVG